MNGLVLQYMANPSVYDNMPQTIFDSAKNGGMGRCDYEDLRTQKEDEPDIVWLIKFAARRYQRLGTAGGYDSLNRLLYAKLSGQDTSTSLVSAIGAFCCMVFDGET